MVRKLRSRLTYANVMSTIAVFVAVSTGGAYAANTVFSTDIVDGEVTSADIRNGTVGSGDVGNNQLTTFDITALLGEDIIDGTIGSADIADESLGGEDVNDETLTGDDIFTITGADITSNTVTGGDIQNESLSGADISDGSLNDEDIAEGTFLNFAGSIGVVPASSCVYRAVTGVNAGGDHMVLTASNADAAGGLVYSAEYSAAGFDAAQIKVCNPFAANIDDGTTHFNLLVIEGL